MADIGLAWVNPAPLTKPENVVNFAKQCEVMGCHSMWTIDRIAYDNLEPLTILAAAAGATQRIRLGTSVLLSNLRHPSHVAKIVATLDFISNGRVTLGLGFGSRESDYKAVEVPYDHRGSRAVEQVQLMKRLWTEDSVTHKGKFFNIDNLTIGPRPIQKPHPPIWTGGSAETALDVPMASGGIASGDRTRIDQLTRIHAPPSLSLYWPSVPVRSAQFQLPSASWLLMR